MKKVIYPIFSFILLLFINGCAGYEPIFGSTNLQFEIADYSIEGNKILGNKIYSKLYSLSKSKKDDQNLRRVDLVIKVSKDKNVTTKDSAGKILQYKITLNTDIKVTDFITKDKILNQIFVSSLTYKVQDKYSDTIDLENRSIEDLLNKTYQELVTRLAQNL
ncbi:MAG: hypothetical protein DSY30_00880 [Alphaproteobacteria bacterium]|nr:MAG: hypothetical protein DSY30_00880 [Alphaproteobacteria bacterium]